MAGPPGVEFRSTPPGMAASDDDAELARAVQHDPQAFTALYARYVDPVYRYCYRRLGSREAAEDATSLIFTNALAAMPRYRPERSSFRSWVFAIAHNVVVDAHRAARPTEPIDAILGHEDQDMGPEAALLAAEQQRTLRGLLAQIAPDQRRVLELRLAGLTTAEIASALGRNPGAVRAIQCRAASRLRDLLGSDTGRREVGDA